MRQLCHVEPRPVSCALLLPLLHLAFCLCTARAHLPACHQTRVDCARSVHPAFHILTKPPKCLPWLQIACPVRLPELCERQTHVSARLDIEPAIFALSGLMYLMCCDQVTCIVLLAQDYLLLSVCGDYRGCPGHRFEPSPRGCHQLRPLFAHHSSACWHLCLLARATCCLAGCMSE